MITAAERVSLYTDPEGIIMLSVTVDSTVSISRLTAAQLLELREMIENILEPDRSFLKRLKDLKVFKRQVFTHYRQENDPEKKKQKLELYIETKRVVSELEKKGV